MQCAQGASQRHVSDLPEHQRRARLLRERDPGGLRGGPHGGPEEREAPVRPVRPDARRGRRRELLDGDGPSTCRRARARWTGCWRTSKQLAPAKSARSRPPSGAGPAGGRGSGHPPGALPGLETRGGDGTAWVRRRTETLLSPRRRGRADPSRRTRLVVPAGAVAFARDGHVRSSSSRLASASCATRTRTASASSSSRCRGLQRHVPPVLGGEPGRQPAPARFPGGHDRMCSWDLRSSCSLCSSSTQCSTRSSSAFETRATESFVGFDNYRVRLHRPTCSGSLRNTAGWIMLVPIVGGQLGLAFAAMADRLIRGEAFAKSLIFLPLAISFAGGSVRGSSSTASGLRVRDQHRPPERDHGSVSVRDPVPLASTSSRGTTCC